MSRAGPKTANPVDKHVGGRVRMRRMMLGVSQEKLGAGLGLTFQQVVTDPFVRLQFRLRLDVRRAESSCRRMRDVELLVEAYLTAERDLVAAVDSAGGKVPLPDGRTVTVGRAEFDALLSGRCKRAWVMVRRNAPMPPRR